VHPSGGEASVRLVDPSMHGQRQIGRGGEDGSLSATIETPPAGVWEVRVFRDRPPSSEVEFEATVEMSVPAPSGPETEPARFLQAPATRFRPALIDLDLAEHAHTVGVAAWAPDGVELALFVYRWDGEGATPVGRAHGRTPHVRLDRPPPAATASSSSPPPIGLSRWKSKLARNRPLPQWTVPGRCDRS
jgi:hypothetical protein